MKLALITSPLWLPIAVIIVAMVLAVEPLYSAYLSLKRKIAK